MLLILLIVPFLLLVCLSVSHSTVVPSARGFSTLVRIPCRLLNLFFWSSISSDHALLLFTITIFFNRRLPHAILLRPRLTSWETCRLAFSLPCWQSLRTYLSCFYLCWLLRFQRSFLTTICCPFMASAFTIAVERVKSECICNASDNLASRGGSESLEFSQGTRSRTSLEVQPGMSSSNSALASSNPSALEQQQFQ